MPIPSLTSQQYKGSIMYEILVRSHCWQQQIIFSLFSTLNEFAENIHKGSIMYEILVWSHVGNNKFFFHHPLLWMNLPSSTLNEFADNIHRHFCRNAETIINNQKKIHFEILDNHAIVVNIYIKSKWRPARKLLWQLLAQPMAMIEFSNRNTRNSNLQRWMDGWSLAC